MIQDDEHIKISDIFSLSNKGKNMTLAEKERLDMLMDLLPTTSGYLDAQNKLQLFTCEQLAFVKYILVPYIKHNIPKLTGVMAVYGLHIDTTFVWEDTDGRSYYCNDNGYF